MTTSLKVHTNTSAKITVETFGGRNTGLENKEVHIFALYLCFILCRFNMTSATLVSDSLSELHEGKIVSEFVQSNHKGWSVSEITFNLQRSKDRL